MKKLLFLLLGLAVAATASAGIVGSPVQKKEIKQVRTSKVQAVTRANGLVAPGTPIPFNGWDNQFSNVLRSREAITWDFEDAEQFAQFMAVDNDEDGFNWEYYNNTGLTTGRMTAHGGEGLVASASYDNDSGTALNPDNWLVSPQVTLGGALTFWAMGQDASYAAEKFAVYVCVGEPTGTESFTMVAGDFTATGSYVQYEIDLSAYQGQVGCFAIVHHNITDMFFLNVDDIVLDAGAVALPYPVVPTGLTVDPGVTTANVVWDNDEAASNWNLRYRPYTEGAGDMYYWPFTLDSYQQDMQGWQIYDADGDGNNWGLSYSDDTQSDVCFFSESWSYDTYEALTPDNYLFTPEVPLKGVLKFTYWGASNTYVENFMVYALIGEDMYALADADYVTSTTHVTEVIDLSEFDGAVGQIVFRHYNCEDQMAMYIDEIMIGTEFEPAPWVYANGLTEAKYTIEGLDPETKYEVQVMGYNEAHESDWCDIVEFTTLGEEPVIPDVYMLGGDDQGWAPNRGIKFDYNAEDNIYTLNYTFPAETNYFGFTTVLAEYDDQGSWDYIEPYRFGAIAEGDNFIFYDEYNGQPLDLTWDAYKAFQIGAGEYDIVVDLTSMKVILTKVNVEPPFIRGDVDMSGEVKIGDVTALINYLLNGDASLVDLRAADCDESGDVKIGDVTALINYLLNGVW
jgi:hypothetical protein